MYRERPEIIVLTAVLPDSANTHIQPYVQKVVDTINGMRIESLADVIKAFETPANGHHVIQFMGSQRFEVIEAEAADRATEEVLTRYGIPAAKRL